MDCFNVFIIILVIGFLVIIIIVEFLVRDLQKMARYGSS